MDAVEHIVMAAGASQPHGKQCRGNGETDDEQPLEEIVLVSFHGLPSLLSLRLPLAAREKIGESTDGRTSSACPPCRRLFSCRPARQCGRKW